ncbi:MAG: copper resistance protein CopC [Candidatus Sulfobium sp.]|jgi:methionine-rich copper-binding protein CopC
MKPLVVFIALLFIFPAAVSAHVHVREYSPKKGAVVTVPPARVSVTFSDSVEPIFSGLTVIDGSGATVSGKTEFFKDNTVMETGLTKNLAPGKYTVKWKCVSEDGHKENGSYTFTVK